MTEQYVTIKLEDVMQALSKCKDEEEKQVLCKIYTNEDYNELGKKRIKKDSKVYQIIHKIKSTQEQHITIEMLSFALTRSMNECNHTMRNDLNKYIHQYFDNVENSVSNDALIYKILNDKKIITYIKKYTSWEDYEMDLKEKKKCKKESKPQSKEEKRMSYVMIG